MKLKCGIKYMGNYVSYWWKYPGETVIFFGLVIITAIPLAYIISLGIKYFNLMYLLPYLHYFMGLFWFIMILIGLKNTYNFCKTR